MVIGIILEKIWNLSELNLWYFIMSEFFFVILYYNNINDDVNWIIFILVKERIRILLISVYDFYGWFGES